MSHPTRNVGELRRQYDRLGQTIVGGNNRGRPLAGRSQVRTRTARTPSSGNHAKYLSYGKSAMDWTPDRLTAAQRLTTIVVNQFQWRLR